MNAPKKSGVHKWPDSGDAKSESLQSPFGIIYPQLALGLKQQSRWLCEL